MVHLHDLIDSINANNLWEPSLKSRIKNEFPDQIEWVLTEAQDAVCFDVGDVEGLRNLKPIPELFKTPYLVTWMQARLKDGILGILASQTEEKQWNIALFNKRSGVVWQMVNILKVYIDELGDIKRENILSCSRKNADLAFDYSFEAINVFGRFLVALNCKNVERQEHPAPKFLNSKRIEKKKQPLFSYWTLHLSNDQSVKNENRYGTHSSPRLHLRRGHVRQYAPGKYTWVDSCIVGNKEKGIVFKDYSLKHATEGLVHDATHD